MKRAPQPLPSRQGIFPTTARFTVRPIACAVMLACSTQAGANPTAPKVAAGAASFNATGNTFTVTNAPGTIVNWQSFSIGRGEQTRFLQQSASSAILNRVVGADASSILGTLSSNGRVFLVNPHGIVFGAGSRIDTAGFIASTLNVADRDFLTGRLKFEGGGNGVLRNEGTIRASGDIMLVGPAVENAGLIRSDAGSVLLAAGRSVTITSPDAQGVRFELQAPTDSALNVGAIEAHSAIGMFGGTLRHSGEIRAASASIDSGGRVVLSAQKEAVIDAGAIVSANGAQGGNVVVQSGGTTLLAGRVEAAGSDGAGGTVHVLGRHVGLIEQAEVDASGTTDGGTILVGGDYRGENAAVQNASRTFVANRATLRADAIASGDGGKVIIWSNEATRLYGSVSARGGEASGNGGFVETSSKGYLDVTRAPNLSAPKGRGGVWLLDPFNITVTSADATISDVDASANADFRGTASNSTIAAGMIQTVLNGGNSVIIDTTGAGADAGNIVVNSTITKTAGGEASLTLNAHNDITIKQSITSSAGRLNMIFDADQDNVGGGVVNLGNVTLNADGGSINATGEIVNVAGGATINSGFNVGTLNVSGGTLSSSAALTVGNMNLSGGSLTGTGLLRTNGATSVTNTPFLNGKTWENAGTVTIGPGSTDRLFMQNDAVFSNLAAGTLLISSTAGEVFQEFSSASNAFQLNNAGLIRKTSTGTQGLLGAGTFNNNAGGTLDVDVGTLNLTVTGNYAGTFNVDTAAALRLTIGTHTLNAGTSLTGTGTGELQVAGGTMMVNAPLVFDAGTPALTMTSGTIAGASNLTLNNAFNLSGGTLTGTGVLRTGGATSVTNTPFLSGKTWENAGTVTIGPGSTDRLFMQNDAVFSNLAAGTLLISSTTGEVFQEFSSASNAFQLNNAGLIRKTSTGTQGLLGAGTFNNNAGGTLDVDAGTLTVPVNGTYSGTINIASGATFRTNGQNLTNSSTGVIGGSGTLDLGGNTLTNEGILRPGAASGDTTGTFTIAGQLNQGSGASVDIELGGTAAGEFDVLAVTGNAALAGTLNLSTTDGYAITGGDNFTVLTAAAVSGTFGTISKTFSNAATPTYNAASVVLALGAGGTLNSWIFDGDGSWADAGRWSLGHVPTASEQVAIDRPAGLFTITIPAGTFNIDLLNSNENITIAGIFGVANASTINATLAIDGGTLQGAGPLTVSGLTLAGATLAGTGGVTVTGPLVQVSGASQVTGPLTTSQLTMTGGALTIASALNIPGPLVWNDGTIRGAGALNTAGATTLGGGLIVLSNKTWNNSGTVTFGSADLTLAGGSTFNNSVAGTINIGSPGSFAGNTAAFVRLDTSGSFAGDGVGTNSVNNAGVINKTGSSSLPLTQGGVSSFNNTNRVDVTSGSLQVNVGGTDSGRYEAAGSAVLSFSTDRTFNSGTSFTGAGTVTFAGGTQTFGAAHTFAAAGPTIRLNNGTLSAADALSFTGPFTWTSGMITGAGALNTSGATTLGAGAIVLASKTWNNAGGVNHTGSALTLSNNAEINNQAPGIWTVATSDTAPIAGIGVFRNAGRLVNEGPTPHDLSVSIFGNSGGIEVNAGTLTLNAADSPDTGKIAVAGGATLILGGRRTLGTGSDITGSGTVRFSNGQVDVNDGYSIAGSGTSVVSGGVTTFNTAAPTVTFSNPLTMTSGQLDGQDGLITNGFNWSGGIISAIAGGAPLTTNGVTNVSGSVVLDTRSWNNAGTVNQMGTGSSQVILRNGAVIANHTSAAWNLLALDVSPLNGGTFKNLGSFTKSAASNQLIDSAFANSGQVNVEAATLTFGALAMTGGSLRGQGTAKVNGLFTWSGGSMAGPGVLATDGTTSLTGTVGLDGRTWNNTGIVNQTGASRVDLLSNAVIDNQASGAWNVSSTGPNALNGAGVFNNAGTLTKNGIGAQDLLVTAFNNSGQVSVQNGTLTLNAASAADTGDVAIASIGTLRFGGSRTLGAASDVTGSGVAVFGAGTVNINGGYSIGTSGATIVDGGTALFNTPLATLDFVAPLTMSGGVLGGSDAIATTGFTWAGGTITGSAPLNTAATTNVTGGVTLDGRVWNSAGNVSQTAGRVTLSSNATINNQGGWFVSTAEATPLSGSGTFNNTGSFTKNGSNAQTLSPSAFNNTGQLNVPEGTLATTVMPTNNGTIDIASGAVLSTNGQNLTNAGTLQGAGRLNLTSGRLTNSGSVRPGAATGDTSGTLTITGNFTQTTGGRLDVEIGGPAAGNFDVLAVSGSATLAGTLDLSTASAYTATSGHNFTILTAASRSGTFGTIEKTFSKTVTPSYTASSVLLALSPAINAWTFDGSDSWSNAARWSLGHVPFVDEDVHVNRPGGTFTITVPSGTFAAESLFSNENITVVGRLGFSNPSTINGTLAINSGTLQGAGPMTVNGALTLTGGTLGSTGGVTVNGTTTISSGIAQVTGTLATSALSMTGGLLVGAGAVTVDRFDWSGGTLAGAGLLTTTGPSNISASIPVLLDGRTWNNAGIVNQAGSSRLALANNAVINNQTGARWNLSTTDANPLSGGTFNNLGTLANAGSTNYRLSTSFNNSGTLNLGSSVRFANVGTFTMTGGAIRGGRIIELDGTFNWSGGTIGGIVSGRLETSGFTNVTGNVTLGREWRNSGSLEQTGASQVRVGDDAKIANVGAWKLSSTHAEPIGTVAQFFNEGTFTKTADVAQSIDYFNNTGVMSIHAGTLTVNSLVLGGGDLTPIPGTLNGAGAVAVVERFDWLHGKLAGAGSLTTTGRTDIGGFSIPHVLEGRTWNNAGIVYHGSELSLAKNAVINNQAGAQWNVQVGVSGTSALSGGTFNNLGTLTNSSNRAYRLSTTFNNSGQIDTGRQVFMNTGIFSMTEGAINGTAAIELDGTFNWSGGTIGFDDAPGWATEPALLVTRGTANVTQNVTLDRRDWRNFATVNQTGAARVNLTGATVFNQSSGLWNLSSTDATPFGHPEPRSGSRDNTQFYNFGSFTKTANVLQSAGPFVNNAMMTVAAGTLDLKALSMTAGTLNGAGAVSVSGPFYWSEGGTLAGTGLFTTNGESSQGIISAFNNLLVDARTWNNAGAVIQSSSGSVRLANNAVINNQVGGRWSLSTSGDVPISGAGVFNNHGTLDVHGGSVRELALDSFNNTGLLNLNAGTLMLPNTRNWDNFGTVNIAAGAILSTGGANITNNGGIHGYGTLQMNAGTLINHDILYPGASPGALTIVGNFVQASSGKLLIELGGTSQGINYDVLRVTGTANLGGTLNVSSINGFTGVSGDTFDVLTYANRKGDFSTRHVPANTTFQFSSNAAFYRLTRTATVPNRGAANVQSMPANNAVTGNAQLFTTVGILNDQSQRLEAGVAGRDEDAAAKKKAEEEAAAKKKKGKPKR